jgi:hypothetical protein
LTPELHAGPLKGETPAQPVANGAWAMKVFSRIIALLLLDLRFLVPMATVASVIAFVVAKPEDALWVPLGTAGWAFIAVFIRGAFIEADEDAKWAAHQRGERSNEDMFYDNY